MSDGIKWKLGSEEEPKSGTRVAIKLPDGRVCSGLVTDIGGIRLEYVDSIDLMSYALNEKKEWVQL